MRYAITEIDKAKNYGFQPFGHKTNGDLICINEKELFNAPTMSGTLEERVTALDAELLSDSEAKIIMLNLLAKKTIKNQ